MWRRSRPVIAVTVLAVLAGCGSVTERSDAATDVAARFLTAVATGDGAAACVLLAPATVEQIEQDSGMSCGDAVVEEDLPEAEPVTSAHVYGQWAQVRLGEQTLFLAVFPGGWRVVAAGCRPRGERPYECVVDGGG